MASVFNTLIDAFIPTRILPGAFAKTLREQATRVRVLYQHNEFAPIGKPTKLEENADGLFVEGKISQTALGKDALTLLRDGVIEELSIGFDPLRWEIVKDGQGNGNMERHISELKLWEVSLVTFGANKDARVMSVHSLLRGLTPEVQSLVRPILVDFIDRRDVELAEILAATAAEIRETHVGKRLSAKSLAQVKTAFAAIQKLIDAADDTEEDEAAPLGVDTAAALRELELMALDSAFGATATV